MKKIIPHNFHGIVPEIDQLFSLIRSYLSVLEASLTSGLNFYSENAYYISNSLEISSITLIDNNNYVMNYTFRWEVFNGCLDINAQETMIEKVSFKVQPDCLEFDIINFEPSGTENEL